MPKDVNQYSNEKNALLEVKAWFEESINRGRNTCRAAVNIKKLTGHTREELV
jgi:hypothetical protein